MEYLVDTEQSRLAAELLGEGLTADALETEIERLRAAYYQIRFNAEATILDTEGLVRYAFLLATLVSSKHTEYPAQLVGKALSVAAVIFEYLAEVSSDPQERMVYALNAILFYSKGEQEAQSATLARKILRSGLVEEVTPESDTSEAWRLLFLFLSQDFKACFHWEKDASADAFENLWTNSEHGHFWIELLAGCLSFAKLLVWGGDLNPTVHFDRAVSQARTWGDTQLTWLGLTVREVGETMWDRSLRKRLTELGVPGWASETLTMDSVVQMWLPHRDAFLPDDSSDLDKGILADEARISLINMPTSAGKSLIAEIAILFELTRDTSSKAIWIVPSRALVYEIQSRLTIRLRRIGVTVSSVPGGLEADPEDAETWSAARVFILTPEKLDGLLRRNPSVMDHVRVVVVDEVQKIGEPGRGWLFETVIAWLLLIAELTENLRLIFLSAVLPNRPDFESWLGQQGMGFVVRWASWRPTRLALFLTSGIARRPWTTKLIQRHSELVVAEHPDIRWPQGFDATSSLFHLLRSQKDAERDSTLVFFFRKEDVELFVGRLSREVAETIPTPTHWAAISSKFASVYGVDHPFTKAISRGIGINHGDIPLWLRHIVERAFRSAELPILVANQAVLEGVNFPIENLIIGCLGPMAGRNFRFRLRPLDYINLVGRVGRALVDTEGRCFLVWHWFYERAVGGDFSWDMYRTPTPTVDDIHSILALDEEVLLEALTRLCSSIEGIDESAFDGLRGDWRDRLDRLHSCALALLEEPGTQDYTKLSRWLEKTLAWYELGTGAREALHRYAEAEWRGFQYADRQLYRIASLSGLSVPSSEEIRNVARDIIDTWSANMEPAFETVFSQDRYDAIMNLRECWRRHPVLYMGRWPANVNHHEAAMAWIGGEDWADVARIICANHQNLNDRNQAGIMAAYVATIFEFRLPWVLGALAIAAKDMEAPDALCHFLEDVPLFMRYGVNNRQAVSIAKVCAEERSVAIALASKYLETDPDPPSIKTWMQGISLDQLKEWLPDEPETILLELQSKFRSTRERDWTLRREGQVVTKLAGWENYGWQSVAASLQSNHDVSYVLRPEPENPFDPYAVAVDTAIAGEPVHVGYIPAAHSEEVMELLQWGRVIEASLRTRPSTTPPRISLRLQPVV